MTQVKFNRRPFDGSFNNLVSDLLAGFPVLDPNASNQDWKGSAPVNITEKENGYDLDLVAPGFEKSDFKVNLENNLLTITAERKEEQKEENSKQIRREFSYKSIKRSFTLDEKIDASGIEAKYVNGILTLNLPKKAEVKEAVKQISIQ